MSENITKEDEKTIKISETVIQNKSITLDALNAKKVFLQNAIDSTQASLNKLNDQMDVIVFYISEAKKLGVKTQEEINEEEENVEPII